MQLVSGYGRVWMEGAGSNPGWLMAGVVWVRPDLMGCLTGTRTRLTRAHSFNVHPKGPEKMPDCRVRCWNQAEMEKPARAGFGNFWGGSAIEWRRSIVVIRPCWEIKVYENSFAARLEFRAKEID